jgi:hypothetical protein
MRAQTSQKHAPDSERKYFPMQFAPYAAYKISKAVTIEGTFNFGDPFYDGQATWAASVLIQPSFDYPQLRIGHFQPTIGVRYDDHTMLVRTVPRTDYLPLIAVNYAEYGASLNYNRFKWFSAEVGVFGSDKLAENKVNTAVGGETSLVSDSTTLLNGRLMFTPRFGKGLINTWLGASYLGGDEFILTNAFLGVGLEDNISLFAEYARSENTDVRTTNAITTELMWKLLESVYLYARAEYGITERFINGQPSENEITQYVLGAQIFLLPYLELRPEWRIQDTELTPRTEQQFRTGRFAMQIHLFY